jgi:hypothetical protein
VIIVELSEAVLNARSSQSHSIVLVHFAKLRLGAVHIHAEGYSNTLSGGHTNHIEHVRPRIRDQQRSIVGIHCEHFAFHGQILPSASAFGSTD